MKRKMTQFDSGKMEAGGAGSGTLPSSSLRGSQWGKGMRPTEEPMSKMELRAKQRQAQPSEAKPRESWDEWQARNKASRKKDDVAFAKGGMVRNDYAKKC